MDTSWVERDDGILFDTSQQKTECITEELERLCLEERAVHQQDGIRLPYESAVLLSREERELLGLPSINPYQLMLRADGDLGHHDLHYIVEVLKPDGTPFIRPAFRGCLLHLDSDTCYLLNVDQYQMVCLARQSNRAVPQMPRKELSSYNLVNLAELQKHARKTDAKLDHVLAEGNNKVIIPEKLDIEFREDANGEIHVEPVLLTKEDNGDLRAVDSNGFQGKFDKYRMVQDIYRTEDRTRYVCRPEVKKGLEKIKEVKHISKADRERYREQPRELFPDAVFHFQKKEAPETEETEGNWLPDEGVAFDDAYSERVKGVADIQKSQYYGSGHKVDWLRMEGEDLQEPSSMKNGAEASKTAMSHPTTPDPAPMDDDFMVAEGQASHGTRFSNEPSSAGAARAVPAHPKKTTQALDIKDNAEIIDYEVKAKDRAGALDGECLNEGIQLLDYQQQGVQWMFSDWEKGYNGVLLADDMGLGKTLQTLAFITALKKGDKNQEKPVLIVAPIALLKNWQQEYAKFIQPGIFRAIVSLHGSALHDFETGERTPNGKKKLKLRALENTIALTTYETLRDYQFSFAEITWGIIIVDEAQKMKNPSTGVTKAIKAMKYDYTICLSGTPVENSWVDLWSIMDFVQPGKLRDLKWFKETYVNQISADKTDTIVRLGKKLKERLTPLFLRRMKKDKLQGLPQKYVHECMEQMPEYQKRCYMSVIERACRQEMHPLMMIARLRDISLHPDIGTKRVDAFYQMEPQDIIRQSARLIATFRVLDEIKSRDEKALVFLVSKKMQAVLKYIIERKYGITILPAVNGSLNGQARQRIVDQFNTSEGFDVLILSPEAAGVGFTITSANHVIHLSRTWNPAKEDQATDRVYRIGQKRDVHVYLPIACHKEFGRDGSFDEKLNRLLDYKRKLSENVLFPTGDSQRDGFRMFYDLTKHRPSNMEAYYWDIGDIDNLNGDAFEEIIADLYNHMDGYQAEKTQHSHDYGVDIVVTKQEGHEGLLIQCKHKEVPDASVGKKGVQEVSAAVCYYKKLYPGYTFQPVAVTNAVSFSRGAEILASDNGVKLIARDELIHLLKEHPVIKKC